MALFKRATDILSANLHELLDGFEHPDRMLRQALREIEQACEMAMNAAAKAIAQERLLARRTASLRADVARWRSRAEAALSRNDEQAARSAVTAMLRQQELAELCEEQQQSAAHDAARLRDELFQLRSRLAEARHLADMQIARSQMTAARRTVTRSPPTLGSGSSALSRFQQASERISREEAESIAVQELREAALGNDGSEFDTRIELELEALKAEVSAPADSE